ncbi:MAG: hypothetical protein EP320_00635 [Rhodobacteraceae bacterium]|nr:hypothetical protein [Stutzerimonas balearica]TNF16801.1 MAG: hypothetical protein EP320_00635 [Paracoccaceae bacterium]
MADDLKKSGRRPADRSVDWRQLIWSDIRKKTEVFEISDLTAAIGVNRKTAADYLMCLAAGGYVEHFPASAPGKPDRFKTIRDTGHHAPRLRRDGTPVVQGQAVLQMWSSMQILKDFTYRDLIETATVEISDAAAKSYCHMLLQTGYLRVLSKASPRSGRIAKYRLVRPSGPKPPQIQRVKRVFDPNTKTVYYPEDQR